ncbi:choice-of-anchor I family protein [Tamlana fucoidanivorans]|uniref:Alkaline phosphatase n=1 Tax=Allotamlana fucoidanivorans TaxID=2583814 RepID=A0A5C4SGC0_9FLAO|nr:choice-of-anchor I family protein [Tamlana fucoidanivorans]TNJ42570.1 alkaline phosphatase [Tamlana fucoidanivorans]
MKFNKLIISAVCVAAIFGCQKDGEVPKGPVVNTEVNFKYKSSIKVGGEGASEISAYDPISKRLFTVNVESTAISVHDISDLSAPVTEALIDLSAYGAPNSVAVHKGKLAVAVEADPKQNPGKVLVYNTANLKLLNEFIVGALPDMVIFSKDGKLIISANEGEPNDSYTIDPLGTVSIIDLSDDSVTTLDFSVFNGQEAALADQGFRVFGPGATLAQDVEPEYVAVSDDSKTAWVSLQENNGMAKVNIETKTIEAIYPLGFKDFNAVGNAIDASDKDGVKALRNWPVLGIYQPDAITSINISGTTYIFSANEGDARDYGGYSEELRVEDLTLDETAYPLADDFQNEINLGRLKTTSTLGDIDNDGDVDQIYNYGARSFSVWSESGNLLYDSGNSISKETLAKTPEAFNGGDKRSDDKGAEPEAVTVLNMGNQRYILFVGLERNNQVLMYDVTNPVAPVFMDILSHTGDVGPEGLLVIPAADSPNGKDLLVISNEVSGTVSFYENIQ